MNRKLRKLIIEEKRAVERLSEAQEHLNKVREARVKEEEREMVRALRSMGLNTWDMFNLMTGIQDGNFGMEMRRMLEDAQAEDDDEPTSGTQTGEGSSENDPEADRDDAEPLKNASETSRDEEDLLSNASVMALDADEEAEMLIEDEDF